MKYNTGQVFQVYHRGRNFIRVRANELVKQKATSYEERKNQVWLLKWWAYLYKRYTENKNILLRGENEKGEKWIKVIEYMTRFNKRYINRLLKKLKEILKPCQNMRSAYFLTLTISFNDFVSIEEGARWAQHQKNSLLTRLRREKIITYYVSITEVQELNTKNIHFHILIFTEYNENGRIRERITIKELEEIIKRNWKYFFKIERVEAKLKENGRPEKDSMFNYLSKYLIKTLKTEENQYDSDTMVILWALDMRIMTNSRKKPGESENKKGDLINKNKNNSNGLSNTILWEYVGVFSNFQVPLQEGIYKEDDIHPEILDVIYKFLNNKSKLKKIF